MKFVWDYKIGLAIIGFIFWVLAVYRNIIGDKILAMFDGIISSIFIVGCVVILSLEKKK